MIFFPGLVLLCWQSREVPGRSSLLQLPVSSPGLVPLVPVQVTVSTGGGRASLPLLATRREGRAFHRPSQTQRAHKEKKHSVQKHFCSVLGIRTAQH